MHNAIFQSIATDVQLKHQLQATYCSVNCRTGQLPAVHW